MGKARWRVENVSAVLLLLNVLERVRKGMVNVG